MYESNEDSFDYYHFNWSVFEDEDVGQHDWGVIYEHPDDDHFTVYDRFFQYQHRRRFIYGFILISLIIVGVIGNVLVIVTSVSKSRRVNSAFYVLLVNLSSASLILLLFEYPLLLYENVFLQPWKMGELFCQLHGYVQYCAFYGVAYALVIVLVFRLLQVVIPDRISPVNNTCVASVVCLVKWVVIMLANVPMWIGHGLYDEIEGTSFCYHKHLNESKSQLHSYLILHFLCAFVVPVMIMVVIATRLILQAARLTPVAGLYGNVTDSAQLQRNTTVMLVSLIVAFIVCWAPSNIFIVMLGFDYFDHDNFLALSIVSDVFMALACANPCLNPWLVFLSLRSELVTPPRRAETSRQNSIYDGSNTESTHNPSVVTTDFGSNNDQAAFTSNIEMDSTSYPAV